MNIALNAGKVKEAMAKAEAGSRDLWQVPIENLHVIEGFNVRSENDEYRARVEHLTNLILANGFSQARPLAGYVAMVGNKQLIYVTDGHRRLAAAKKAIEQGAEIKALPVVVSPKGTSVEDLTVGLVTLNDGEPLNQYEIGVVCKRLVDFGWDEKTIGGRLGLTTQRVGDLLSLLSAPKAIRDLVSTGTVSATQAIETVKRHGPAATEKLEAGAAKAKATGKRKATRKHIEADKPTCRAVVKKLLEWDAAGGADKELKAVLKMAREAVS